MAVTCLLLSLEFLDVKKTNRLSWAVNVLMWSDLTFEPFRIFLIIAVIFTNAVFLQYHVVLLRWVHLGYFTVVSFYIVCI